MNSPRSKAPWVDGALYNENRNKWTYEELLPYADQWVAFNHDGTRILAAAKDLQEAMERLKASGLELQDGVWEHLDPPDIDTWL